jgi:hypothetical protein
MSIVKNIICMCIYKPGCSQGHQISITVGAPYSIARTTPNKGWSTILQRELQASTAVDEFRYASMNAGKENHCYFITRRSCN